MATEGIGGIQPGQGARPAQPAARPAASKGFLDALDAAQQGTALRMSSHARTRLEQRDIALGSADLARLQEGVQRAEEKGVKQPLIMMDDLAFIVSTPNRTIITAMDAKAENGAIFTNIDGVVVV